MLSRLWTSCFGVSCKSIEPYKGEKAGPSPVTTGCFVCQPEQIVCQDHLSPGAVCQEFQGFQGCKCFGATASADWKYPAAHGGCPCGLTTQANRGIVYLGQEGMSLIKTRNMFESTFSAAL